MQPYAMITLAFFLFAVFLCSIGLTRVVFICAKAWSWLAIPNGRSSHTTPTAKGGGIAIVTVFFSAMLVLWAYALIPGVLVFAFMGGGLLAAGVSVADDWRHVHIGVRLLVHFIAAAIAIFFIGNISSLDIGGRTIQLHWFSNLVPIGIVWMMNMYNFMDGADGLAGSQAVLTGMIGGVFLAIVGAWDLALIAWVLAAAVGGFLIWNWSPASIFMSDVGSIFIGFVFAVLAIASERSGALPLLVWVLLLAVFVTDATLTTLRRIVKGEEWFAGHHNFGFQQWIERGYTHRQVTLGVLGMNGVLILFVVLSRIWPQLFAFLFVAAFAMLAMVWWRSQRFTARTSL